MTYNEYVEEAARYSDILSGIRRELHQMPEFGLDNPKSTERCLASVDGLGEVFRSQRTSGAALLIRGEQPGPTVLLRTDTDALAVVEDTGLDFASTNGFMHACGHDLHMAMAIGASHLLHTHKDRLRGNVVVWFQPGEEGHGGADVMLEEGLHLVSGELPIARTTSLPCSLMRLAHGCMIWPLTDDAVSIAAARIKTDSSGKPWDLERSPQVDLDRTLRLGVDCGRRSGDRCGGASCRVRRRLGARARLGRRPDDDGGGRARGPRREEGGVGAAEPERHAEALRVAHADIGTELAGRLERRLPPQGWDVPVSAMQSFEQVEASIARYLRASRRRLH